MTALDVVLGHYVYWVTVLLLVAGLYVITARGNMIKKLVGLGVFQSSVFLFYVSLGKVAGGTAPTISENFTSYSNPLPHVLILTAIVVGIATLSVGLALSVRIREAFGTVEEDEIFAAEPDVRRDAGA